MEAFSVPAAAPFAQEWWTRPPTTALEWLGEPRKSFTAVVARKRDAAIAARFTELADEWERDTGLESFAYLKVTHRAFPKILRMGNAVLPMILNRLAARPTQWLVVLGAMTDEDPTGDATTMEEAVKAWHEWGRSRGLLG